MKSREDILFQQKIFIETNYKKLLKFSNDQASIKSSGWSAKEIIGHLIDSASNNHQRFIRAQFKDNLIFDTYNQDDWVETQNYQSFDWKFLLNHFYNFNLHIIEVLKNIPDEQMVKERRIHNLFEIAYKTVSADRPVTLEYFVEDYYDHLHHHIEQTFNKFE